MRTMIRKGDTITDFRGDEWTYLGITRQGRPGKSTKILARDSSGWQQEFYVTVFEDDIYCEGHESLSGPIGNEDFCDGSCVLER